MRRVAGASGVRSGTGGRKRTGPVGRRTAHPARRLAWLLPPSTIHWPLDTRHVTESSYKSKFQFPLPILHPIRRFLMVRRNSRISPADDRLRPRRGSPASPAPGWPRLAPVAPALSGPWPRSLGPRGRWVLPASFARLTVSPPPPGRGSPALLFHRPQPPVRVQPSRHSGAFGFPPAAAPRAGPAPPRPRYRSTLITMADTEQLEKKASAEEEITGRSSASDRALPRPTRAVARSAPPAPGCRSPLLTVLRRNAAAG